MRGGSGVIEALGAIACVDVALGKFVGVLEGAVVCVGAGVGVDGTTVGHDTVDAYTTFDA